MDPLNSQTTHSDTHTLQAARGLGKKVKAWLILCEAASHFLGQRPPPPPNFNDMPAYHNFE